MFEGSTASDDWENAIAGAVPVISSFARIGGIGTVGEESVSVWDVCLVGGIGIDVDFVMEWIVVNGESRDMLAAHWATFGIINCEEGRVGFDKFLAGAPEWRVSEIILRHTGVFAIAIVFYVLEEGSIAVVHWMVVGGIVLATHPIASKKVREAISHWFNGGGVF